MLIFIVLVIVFLIIVFFFNNKENPSNRYNENQNLENNKYLLQDHIWEEINMQIDFPRNKNLSTQDNLRNLKLNFLNNINNLSTKFNLGSGTVRSIINISFENILSDYDENLNVEKFTDALNVKIKNDIMGISEELGHFQTDHMIASFLKNNKESYVHNSEKLSREYNLAENKVLDIINKTFNKYINNFSSYNEF